MPSIDRFSCLPDEIICHILTFLPTKHSVRTSVLSKRWNFLWAHVPSLEFDFDGRSVNSEIVNKIVLHHKREIQTLHLHGDYEGTAKEFESWIVNIPNLDISLGERFELPQFLFTCKTVVDLRLYSFDYGFDYIPGIYLPALKKLHLRCYSRQSHESLAHLLSGCPVLEDFSFDDLLDGHVCVSSSILTSLVLDLENENISEFGLKLDTPALRYLKLHCKMPDKFLVGALDSLIEAHISLSWEEEDQDNFIYSRNVLALVGKLHNVRLLTLGTSQMAMIHVSAFFALGIKFHNLTKLDLTSNLGFITSFLENANNLQVLRLEIFTDDIDNQYYWMEPKRVPTCLSSHLQTVNLRFYGCYEEEFDMTRYILMNAKVLKRMEISARELGLKKKFEALKRLASFGRGSQECELLFD